METTNNRFHTLSTLLLNIILLNTNDNIDITFITVLLLLLLLLYYYY